MKILVAAREDCGGAAIRLSRALSSIDGVESRCISMMQTRLKYNIDVLNPSTKEAHKLVKWADAVVSFDTFMRVWAYKNDKKVIAIYSGTGYRRSREGIDKYDRSRGIPQFGTTIDMTCYGLDWLPIPMPISCSRIREIDGVFRLAHAPTNRVRKGTDRIIKAVSGLGGVSLDIIEKVDNKTCLARKARAHALIDQPYRGYGVNALEAWAIGMPVIAGLSEQKIDKKILFPPVSEVREKMLSEIGYLPFCEASTVAGIRDEVLKLSSGKQYYREMCEVGMKYLREFHDPKAVASKLIATIEAV